MSVCVKGWKNVTRECPCFQRDGNIQSSTRSGYTYTCKMGMFCSLVEDKLPTSCPHAPALRAVVEDEDKVLVAVPKDITMMVGYRSVEEFMQGSSIAFYCSSWNKWRRAGEPLYSTLDLEVEEKGAPDAL